MYPAAGGACGSGMKRRPGTGAFQGGGGSMLAGWKTRPPLLPGTWGKGMERRPGTGAVPGGPSRWWRVGKPALLCCRGRGKRA